MAIDGENKEKSAAGEDASKLSLSTSSIPWGCFTFIICGDEDSEVSIRKLAELIAESVDEAMMHTDNSDERQVVPVRERIKFDTSRPDGIYRKVTSFFFYDFSNSFRPLAMQGFVEH
jgi:hypothetical protein